MGTPTEDFNKYVEGLYLTNDARQLVDISRDARTSVAVSETHKLVDRSAGVSVYHCEDGPAIIERDSTTGRPLHKVYMQYDVLHRAVGPAETRTDYHTGVKTSEKYAQFGKLHRLNGPAEIIRYSSTGRIASEAHYANGVPHREDGPAQIIYDRNGNIEHQRYYLRGESVTSEQFAENLARVAIMRERTSEVLGMCAAPGALTIQRAKSMLHNARGSFKIFRL